MVITKLKHYDEVVNYIYKDDYIVDKIIDYYRDFVMNPNNNRKCILFDKVVYEFLYNSKFMDYVKSGFPLIIIATVVSMIILPIAFPFFP